MTLAIAPDELAAILARIPGDQPTGVDLRKDIAPTSVYFRLRDARATARDAERQAETLGGDESLPALWQPVAAMAIGALKEHAKDLEVATWLTEALLRTTGLPGLAAGAAIIAGLVDQYWDNIFPMPDEDGIETRIAAVAGLSGQGYDGTLLQPLRKTALFRRPTGLAFGVWQYEATLKLSEIADAAQRAQRVEAGVLPFEEVEKEARVAGPAHWSSLRNTVTEAMTHWAEMGRLLDEKAGVVSPSNIRVRDVLQLILDTANRFAPPVAEDVTAAPALDGVPVVAGTTAPAGAPSAAPGAILGREQALRQLGEIAAWFKRNEPNAPIAYTLDEAVRRGRMTWPELVTELIPDETARHSLLTSLGIKPDAAPQ